MAGRWGRLRLHVLSRGSAVLRAILLLCLLLSGRTGATDAPSGANDDDVTDYGTRRESSALPSSAALSTRASRGGHLLIGNVQGDGVSQMTTAAPENNVTLQGSTRVSTARKSPRRGDGPVHSLLSSIGNSGSSNGGCQQKTDNSGDSEKGDNTMMMMVGTILMGKLMMLMPMMLLKSASELLESLVSLAMKLVELVQKFLEGRSEGRGGSHGHGGGGKEASHKQVVVLQLPKDEHESWHGDHLPHAIDHESYVDGPHHGQGWSDEHGFHASSYHPLEWSPHHSADGWQHWGDDDHHHQHHNHDELRRRKDAGSSLAYRHWKPGA